MRRNLRRASLIVLLLVATATIALAATVILNFPHTNPAQEHSQWCWAGVTQAVLAYYGTSVSQCTIANYASGYPGVPGRPNCCLLSGFSTDDNLLSGCNYWNYMWGSSTWGVVNGSVQGILSHWGVTSSLYSRVLSQQEIVTEIGAGRPAVMRFGWKCSDGTLACGGHFLDIYGQETDAAYLDYWDPWPGNGATRSLYTWVLDASDHQWTHTLKLASAPGGAIAGVVTDAGTGQPLLGAYVFTYTAAGTLAGSATTNLSGMYKVSGLAAGTYYVRTSNSFGFLDELYNDLPCPGGSCVVTSGTAVTVTAATTTTGINFALLPGGKQGDFTGDLKSDILWRHAARGEVWLWPMNGAVRTAEVRVATLPDMSWEIRGLGDQNGDGRADVLWRHKPTGMVYYWPMNGGTRLAEAYVATVDPAYDIVGTGDYNGDGKSDILWRRAANGELWVWLMNGAAVVSSTYVTTVAPGYGVVGSGDLNADGKADILWRGAGGDVWVWLMNGATPTAMTYVTTVGDLGYQIVGVADHTGDGKADLLWWHATRGEVWLWPMNATALVSQSYVGIVPDTGYRIVASGDYDGDGKADILWHHATRGEVWLWPMNGATRLSEIKVATVPDTGYQIIK